MVIHGAGRHVTPRYYSCQTTCRSENSRGRGFSTPSRDERSGRGGK